MNVSSSATIREKDRKWLYDYVDDDDVMWDEKRVNIKKISRIRRILRAYTHIFIYDLTIGFRNRSWLNFEKAKSFGSEKSSKVIWCDSQSIKF